MKMETIILNAPFNKRIVVLSELHDSNMLREIKNL